MRLRATLYDEALRLYPLAVLINVVGVLMIPGMFCLFRFGLLLTSLRWALVSLGLTHLRNTQIPAVYDPVAVADWKEKYDAL